MSTMMFGRRAAVCRYVIVTLMFLMAVPAAGLADGEMRGERGKDRRVQQMFAELGITQEQQTKLRDIQMRSAPAQRVYRKQAEVVREKIKQELQKDRPSRGALNRYATEMGNLHKQMNLASIDNLLQVKAVLTAEQFSALFERGLVGHDSMRIRMDRGGSGAAAPPPRDGVRREQNRGGHSRDPRQKYRGSSGRPPRQGGFIESSATATPESISEQAAEDAQTPVAPSWTAPEETVGTASPVEESETTAETDD